jgi:hypothetical protein
MGKRCHKDDWNKIPADELAAFDQRLDREPMDIEHLGWVSGGFSGSPVALIRYVQTGAPPAEAILKFCRTGEAEAAGIFTAYRAAPKAFSKAHLVKPIQDFPLHEWSAVLMDVAGGDLSSYQPIAKFSGKKDLTKICEAVVRSILGEWNAGTIRRNRDMDVGEFFKQLLGEGRLAEASELMHLADSFQHQTYLKREIQPDDWLLNPLALIDSRVGTKINAVIGFGHGDLSVHNVLVPTWPKLKASDFLLIDYGSFGHEYPLARDPMYLLVSLATQWLRDTTVPSGRSGAMMRELARAGPQTPDLGLGDYRQVVDTIFETARAWAVKERTGRQWPEQSFLALVGAALTFVGRDIPGLERGAMNDWLFDLAAVVTQEHLKDYVPTGGEVPEPVRQAVPDGMPLVRPLHQPSPTAPTGPAPADTTQAGPVPVAGRAAEGSGADADRPDPRAAALEGDVAGLRERLRTVGPPPAPPSHGGGFGRWLVSLGYWADMADSVLSEIDGFTRLNCNDPPDRFAQAVDDARSAIRGIVNRLPLDTTTTTVRDVTAMSNSAKSLWSMMVQLLRLSMEACGLGHALLAANDQMITATSPNARPIPRGIQSDPDLGELMIRLDGARSALEPKVDVFLSQRPSDQAADLLQTRVDALFKLLDKTYLPQSEGGQRVNLGRIRDAALVAAIALSRLIGAALPNTELGFTYNDLSRLLRVLDDILPSSGEA